MLCAPITDLQLRDPEVAEPDDGLSVVILQADVAAGQPARFVIDRLFTVPGNLDAPTMGDDADVVPFPGRLGHVFLRRHHVVQRAGRTFGRLATVVSYDLHLVAAERGILFEGGANKYAAVSAFVDGVFEFEDEITIGLFGAQPGAALLRIRAPILAVAPDERAVLDRPFAGKHDDPAGEEIGRASCRE